MAKINVWQIAAFEGITDNSPKNRKAQKVRKKEIHNAHGLQG